MATLKVAAVQHETLYGDIDGNIKRALSLVDRAAKGGADLICMSYYWYVGHSDGERAAWLEEETNQLKRLVTKGEITPQELNRRLLHRLAQPIPEGDAWRRIGDRARKHGIHILAGTGPELDNGKIHHTAALFGPRGELVGRHRKTFLWDREVIFDVPGDEWNVFDIGKCKIGVGICSEGQYVPEVTRLLSLKGADVLVVPNGTHYSRSMLLPIPITRAIECQAYNVTVGQVPKGWRFPKIPMYTSCIVSPINHLNPVLAVGTQGSCILRAELDISRLRKERAVKTPIVTDYRFANAVNDMVEGKYSYPMLTEHFAKGKRLGKLMREYTKELRAHGRS